MKKCFFCFGFFALFFSLNSYAQPAAARPAVPAAGSTVTPFLPAKIAGTITLKTPAGVVGQANIVKTGNILVSVDTTIQSNARSPLPNGKMAYLSIDISSISGTSQEDILSGNNLFWVFDKAGKQVPVAAVVLKKVNAADNSNIVNMTVKVPYRLKTDKNLYTIHYRWESKDKQRNIDMLTTK